LPSAQTRPVAHSLLRAHVGSVAGVLLLEEQPGEAMIAVHARAASTTQEE
jgi:hypothetical protein